MGIEEQLADLIEAGKLQPVEDAWLERLDEQPYPVSFFAQTAESLAAAGYEERARFLLEMTDEQLQTAEAWSDRLALLRSAGELVAPGQVHEELVATLHRLYPESPSFAELAELVGLHRAVDDLPKMWQKVDRLRELLEYEVGSVVWMKDKGAGRVIEVNTALESFKVEIEGLGVLPVGFAAAKKHLRRLPPGHFQHRKQKDRKELSRLADENPEELLRLVLTSHPEPLTANDIRSALEGVVDGAQWTSFWNRVRKLDRVLTLPGGRPRYRWAATAEDAVEALEGRFRQADLDHQLELFSTHAERDPELRKRMLATLREEAEEARNADPPRALVIGSALEEVGEDLGQVPWAPAALLRSVDDPAGLILAVEDRGRRESAYRLLVSERADATGVVERLILREEDPRLLDLLAGILSDLDRETLERTEGDLLSHPRRYPAGFTWLAERAAGDERIRERNPLRLLQGILNSLSDADFQPFRRRLLALADSGSTLPRLLSLLDEEQATRADSTLERAAGLEDFQRRLLRNSLHLKFPALRGSGEAPLYATPEAIDTKKAELRQLVEVEIPANRRAIQEARELGDLRENFEYKSARQRHEYLSARVAALTRDLARARPVDASRVDGSSVRLGTRVRLSASDGQGERSYTILGPWDSEPEKGILSNESELASRLLGKELGDEVHVEGVRFTVTEIAPFR